jgi:MarR family transcriptional regulator, organic hydroperoxide resistance regulator
MSNIDFKKISTHPGPQKSMGFLLWRVSTQWRRLLEETLKTFNLTHPQFVILAATGWLTQDKKITTQIEVARMAGLDPNTTSQILDGLEKKKFIKRTIRSCSGRAKYPVVTPLGAEILEKALPAVEKTDVSFFSALSQDEIKTMLKTFQTLIEKPS